MKYKGKAISGSSLLTILGVVCFASMLVAAAVLTGTVAFNSTTVSPNPGNVTVTKVHEVSAVYVGDECYYTFTANSPDDLTNAVLTVTVTKTTLLVTDISSLKVQWNGGTNETQSLTTPSSDVMTITYAIGNMAKTTSIPCVVSVIYNVAASYTVGVSVSGTATA